MTIPFFDYQRQLATIRTDVDAAFARVLASGKLILGPETIAFENAVAQFCSVTHGIGVNSGTDAIKIALRALGVGAGDEVITVANTATPTVSAIRETGAAPVLIDCDEYALMDVTQLERALSRRTKAIVPVHLYGQGADMRAIMRFARAHRLRVVEDCAQAIGATVDGQRVGSFGDAACFSFYPTKNLGAYGDAGMIVTNRKNIAERCRRLRAYGMRDTYHAQEEGYNSRLDELHAAILFEKLKHLLKWTRRRQQIATRYHKEITNPLITLPTVRAKTEHVYHLFVIRCKQRDTLKEHLAANGIGAGIHYPFAIHRQRAYHSLAPRRYRLARAEQRARQILSLPIFPELTETEITAIISTVNAFQKPINRHQTNGFQKI